MKQMMDTVRKYTLLTCVILSIYRVATLVRTDQTAIPQCVAYGLLIGAATFTYLVNLTKREDVETEQ